MSAGQKSRVTTACDWHVIGLNGAGARRRTTARGGNTNMLQWAIIFFVIALVAALLGQRGVAGMSAQIGYLFVGVAVIFLLSLC
jgi:uncharacterized membrane protein YtjA (UPF0391 family)